MATPELIRRTWPLYDLVVRTPRCELRYLDEETIACLLALAGESIHDPGLCPFSMPWHEAPSPLRERDSLRWYTSALAGWQPGNWPLELAVWADGEVVGCQSLMAKDFPLLRSVSTGSWLVRRVHGKGIGTAMRQAVLELAFGGLDALEARTSAFEENEASRRVSEKVGYQEAGRRRARRGDEVGQMVEYVLTAETWRSCRPRDVGIEGLDPCRELFGLGSDRSSPARKDP